MSGLSLEQLGALNDQIAALLRAGVPLETGLARIAGEGPDGGAKWAGQMAVSLSRGDSLPQFLERHGESFPPIYRAVVAAGLRGGRLSLALEQIATTSRRMVELRRALGLALGYPLALLLAGYLLCLYFGLEVAPMLAESYFELAREHSPYLQWSNACAKAVAPLWFVPPLVVVALLTFVWWKSGRSQLLEAPWRARFLGRIPGLRRIFADSRGAVLAEVTGLLVGQSVPLPEALRAAAAATGEPRLAADVEAVVASLERGESVSQAVARPGSIPPMVSWFLVMGQSQGNLAERLKQLGTMLERRATSRAETFALLAPLLFTALFGALVVLSYALFVLWPWYRLLELLTRPS